MAGFTDKYPKNEPRKRLVDYLAEFSVSEPDILKDVTYRELVKYAECTTGSKLNGKLPYCVFLQHVGQEISARMGDEDSAQFRHGALPEDIEIFTTAFNVAIGMADASHEHFAGIREALEEAPGLFDRIAAFYDDEIQLARQMLEDLREMGPKGLRAHAKRLAEEIAEDETAKRDYETALHDARLQKSGELRGLGYTPEEIDQEIRSYDPLLKPDIGEEIAKTGDMLKLATKQRDITRLLSEDYRRIVIENALGGGRAL